MSTTMLERRDAFMRDPKRLPLAVLDAADFMKRPIPPRVHLLAPILTEKSLSMIAGPRGGSKSWLALLIACGVASGRNVLGWTASEPRTVLYVDAEMPGAMLQERLIRILGSLYWPADLRLRILSNDLQDRPLPALDSEDGQAAIEPHLAGVDLLVIDNVSTTMSGAVENDAESWAGPQAWLLELRRRGLAVLLIHHTGKGGGQRGTSKREDILDVSLLLKRPSDYHPSQGSRFEIHYSKARGLMGDAVRPVEVALATDDEGRDTWAWRYVEDQEHDRAMELLSLGAKPSDLQAELGVSRATAFRLQKKAKESQKSQVSNPSG